MHTLIFFVLVSNFATGSEVFDFANEETNVVAVESPPHVAPVPVKCHPARHLEQGGGSVVVCDSL